MNSRVGKVVADCADEVTMGLTWFVLLILHGPFEIYGSIAEVCPFSVALTSPRRAGLGGQVRYGR